MNLPDATIAQEGFFATHFFTVKDQEKSKDFYVRILGGKLIKAENPCYIKLANSWIILNCGGGPTPDKPAVVLETPTEFLPLRAQKSRAPGGPVQVVQRVAVFGENDDLALPAGQVAHFRIVLQDLREFVPLAVLAGSDKRLGLLFQSLQNVNFGFQFSEG
jgi:catechol 2,3-dioxygenase-like lactoylglutathione lyase family enzyme